MSALRPRRPCADGGTTLAEMLVALLVFGVFAGFVSTTVLNTTRLTHVSAVRELIAQRSSLVLAQLSRDLRTAVRVGPATGTQVAFVTANSTEVVFYSNVDPSILRERLYLSGGALFRETKLPDPGTTYPDLTYTSTDPTRTTTRRLAGSALQTAELFTYFVRGGTTPLTSVTAANDLRDITAVALKVSLDPDGPGGQRAVVLESTVRPFNP